MGTNKPIINDLSKLKFKRVKTYKVVFSYEDREFILIDDSSDGDCHLSMLERIWVKKDRCIIEQVAGAITCRVPSDLIRDISVRKPNNVTYSNIDREYFVKMLAEMHFVEGKYCDEYKELSKEADELNRQIRELQRQISNNYKDWRKPSGRGSKQYGDTIKASMAERIKGAEDGEWCEQYNAEYGSTHPEYGGILVDLFNLPVGTTFYCTNGCWSGLVWYNNHGDKVIINDACEVKLTKDNHSLYIQ